MASRSHEMFAKRNNLTEVNETTEVNKTTCVHIQLNITCRI